MNSFQGWAAEEASGQDPIDGGVAASSPAPNRPEERNLDAQLYSITMQSVGIDPVTGASIPAIPVGTLLDAVKHIQSQMTDPHGPTAERARALIITLQCQAGDDATAEASCRAIFADPTSSKSLRSQVIAEYFTMCQEHSHGDELDRLAKEATSLPLAPSYVAYLTKAALAEHVLTIGKPLPDFTLTDIHGNVHRLMDYKGKILLIDFWATWCDSCVRDMPDLAKDYESFHARGLEVLGISLDQDLGKLHAFLDQHPIRWPQVCDAKGWEGDFRKRCGITAAPDTLLISADGTLVRKHLAGAALYMALENFLPRAPAVASEYSGREVPFILAAC